ncbi:hypothetical protein CC86DRAFT_395950 [Ophiobolus disseminans]|uniref:Derlin n=1 Tax=Ophiobolus disseminans TaxID=1469910 RepID=A0A6A6ZTM1_9PLEO|nr:hypothetical protein CC86DRAFT_395950 [Ophiobolus disseminans]
MDVFWTLPPVTRTITVLSCAVSALGYGGIISLSTYVFYKPFVFTTKTFPQLWRLLTGFLITKPKFAILLDPYFLYQYGSSLERESLRFTQPGDFFTYTAFVSTVIVITSKYLPAQPKILAVAVPGIEGEYPCTSRSPVIRIIQTGAVWCCERGVGLGSYTFLPALTLAYAYTFAQDQPTRMASFFILTFEAKYLPFALLFMTLIVESPDSALAQLTGLIAAHMYDFLTRIWPTFGGGKNFITTPQIVKQWFAPAPGTAQDRGYGTAVQGGNRSAGAGADASSGRSTGVSNLWGQAGPGRRLGE